MNKKQIQDLKRQIETKTRLWNNIALPEYYKAYADKEINSNRPNAEDYFNSQKNILLTIYAQVEVIESKISGYIKTNSNQIIEKTNKIKNLRLNSENSIANMENDIEKNKTGVTLKTDKIDEKSRAYLSTSFYTISLITMSFFIYKQLKQ